MQKETRFWAFAAVLMLFLAFNKQLDLQSLLTQTVRYFAYSGGWYHHRQIIQVLFILCLCGVAMAVASILLWNFRKMPGEIRMAAIGLCLLGTFIIIRATSFHHVDRFLGEVVTIGMRWNNLLEFGGILFVAIAGLTYRKNLRNEC